jgi:ParB family chromosome partitioning protein
MHPIAAPELDPSICYAPDDHPPVTPDEIADLADSIRITGQIHPGIVRPAPRGEDKLFEIVSGARRHAAIMQLRAENPYLLFFAHIRPLTDAQAFATADQENRKRRDIPDMQRARAYAHALDHFHHGNHAELAKSLRLPPSELSRYLNLAAVPTCILDAFGDPMRVTLTHVSLLTTYLQKPEQRQRLLEAAARLAGDQTRRLSTGGDFIRPPTILHRLSLAADPAPTHTVTDEAGIIIAVGRRTPKGAAILNFPSRNRSRDPAAEVAAASEILDNLFASGAC